MGLPRSACLPLRRRESGERGPYDAVSSNIMFSLGIATMPTYVGFVVLGVAVLLGQMVFPAWLDVLTPVTTSLLGYVRLRVP